MVKEDVVQNALTTLECYLSMPALFGASTVTVGYLQMRMRTAE